MLIKKRMPKQTSPDLNKNQPEHPAHEQKRENKKNPVEFKRITIFF